MARLDVDVDLLREFERGLDPRHPERSAIPATVLGYGEISTVLEIRREGLDHLAVKRLPMFSDEKEAREYEALHCEYVKVLSSRVGVSMAPSQTVRVHDSRSDRTVVYILQPKMPTGSIGHEIIHQVGPNEVVALVRRVLRETLKVHRFNQDHCGQLELGLDGQISNWSLLEYDGTAPSACMSGALCYLDTSTPLMRKSGVEQLDPELFLRNAPSFLAWVIRALFLEGVMSRYYDLRQVAVDIVANFLKEQRPELLPRLVDETNQALAESGNLDSFSPLSVKEIRNYYREDAWIWRIYLFARRIDRAVQKVARRDYPYILPGKTKR